jgi:hypothetical protein
MILMKHWILLALLVLIPASALAGPHDNARFALHAKDKFMPTKTTPSVCDYSPNIDNVPCLNYTVERPAPGSADVFLMIGQAGSVGVTGASCGILYSGTTGVGIDPGFITWTGCADGLEFPNGPPGEPEWPASQGGMRVTWITCQNQDIPDSGVHVTVGSFYVYAYSEDVLEVTPNNNLLSGAELGLSACGGGTTNLIHLVAPEDRQFLVGRVQFGGDGSQAQNPCGITIVSKKPTTWGKIKSQYQN